MPKRKVTFNCLHCGKPLGKARKKFCNTECDKAYKLARKREQRRCHECGKALPRYAKKFCDHECWKAFQLRKNHCLYCGKLLPPNYKKYCNDECRLAYNRQVTHCLTCGKKLVWPQKKFCSKECCEADKYTPCPVCGKPAVNKYCSHECYAKSRKGKCFGPPRTRKTHPCAICGKETTNKKYCSRACASKALEKTRPCEHCGKSTKNKHYCSIKCMSEARRIIPAHPCEICGEMTYNEKYCSATCMGIAFSTIEPHPCEQCGKETTNKRFCSHECYAQWLPGHINGPDHPNWRGGWEPYYGENWEEQRQKALARDGYECRICGMTDVTHHVHHYIPLRLFDGDWKTANLLENLITLCPNCHVAVTNDQIPCPLPDPLVLPPLVAPLLQQQAS